MDITNTSNVLGKDNPWIAPGDETKFAGEVAAVEHVAREVSERWHDEHFHLVTCTPRIPWPRILICLDATRVHVAEYICELVLNVRVLLI
jgi:hypothetical protein